MASAEKRYDAPLLLAMAFQELLGKGVLDLLDEGVFKLEWRTELLLGNLFEALDPQAETRAIRGCHYLIFMRL